MRYVHEISAALSLLLLLLIPIPLFRRVPTAIKWLAAFGMVAIVLSGLLVRGFTGRDPLDLAGEYLADGICSVHDFGACRNRRARAEAEAKEQARQKAAEEARQKATEEERREQAHLKAEEERREQARRKAEEERREQARLKAEEERREQARLKAEQERREQARLKAEAERRERARLEAEAERRERARLEAEEERREQARLMAAEEARAVEERRRQKEVARKARTYRTNTGSPSPPQAPSSGGCPKWMFHGQSCTLPNGKVCRQIGWNTRSCD